MKKFKHVLFYLLLAVGVIVIAALIFSPAKANKDVTYKDIVTHFENNEVLKFEINENDDKMTIILRDKEDPTKEGEKVVYKMGSISLNRFVNDDELQAAIKTNGVGYNYIPVKETSAWLSYLPIILLVVLMVVMYIIAARSMSGAGGGKMGGFGKAKAKTAAAVNDKNKVTFKDVAGADEEKEELEEIVDYLKAPEKFTKLGAKIPHGVLLMGPPGTGKTLLAKAVAGEAGVPFFSISGSDFVEMYVGVGASRVRDLFDTARKTPASIIFIDEIDAVGRHRGAGLGGGHDEREQTLNQLLVEMDGFGSHDGIIVIAATNRPDILDPALLRPGRFDRQTTVIRPDLNGRIEILKVHAKNKPFESTVDFKDIARMTVGFTGADLANLLNEAALWATRRGKSLIGNDDIEEAFIKVIAGPKKKSRVMKEEEKRNTAYHEAGHAMLAYYLDLDPVQQISIIPSGGALGYTLNPPAEDKYSVYKSEMKKKISMLLGGRAAEEIINGDVSGGASNDIERATATAKQMVTRLGMSEKLGPRCFGTNQSEVFLGRDFSSSQDYSEEVAALIDTEIHEIISTAYENAKSILIEHIDKLHFIAEFLVKNEVMDADQFRATMERDNVTLEEIEQIVADKKAQSRADNAKRAREEEERLAREAAEKARKEAEEGVQLVDTDAEVESFEGENFGVEEVVSEENTEDLETPESETDETKSDDKTEE